MPLRNQIQAITQALAGQPISFLYGTTKEINEQVDRIIREVDGDKIPLICLYPLMPVGIELGDNGSAHNDFSLYMEFRKQTKFELNSADNEAIVNEMLTLANNFLLALREYREDPAYSRYFKLPKPFKAQATPVYNKNDVNDTGVSLTFKVEKRIDADIVC